MKWFALSFSRDTLWSFLGGSVPALSGLVAIPLLIRLLYVDQFALVSLLLSLNLFFFVYDVGLTRAMHYFVPRAADQGRYVAASLLLNSLFVGLVLGLILALGVYFIVPSLVFNWINVDPALKGEAVDAFRLVSIGIIPTLLIHVIKGYTEGKRLFFIANIGKIISGVSMFVFPVVTALMSPSIVLISASIALSRLLSFIVYACLVSQSLEIDWKSLDYKVINHIVRYTFWSAISGLFSAVFIYGDRFFVAGYVDSASLAIYISSQDVLIRYLIIPWAISIPLVPLLSKGESFIKDFYRRSMKVISIISAAFVIVISLALVFLVPYWFKGELVYGVRIISSVLMIGVFFASFSQLPLISLYALGKARLLTSIFLVEAGLYLMVAPIIFGSFGVIGAACVWSGRLILELVLLILFFKKVCKTC